MPKTYNPLRDAARYIKEGNTAQAAPLIHQVLNKNPENANGWYLASYLFEDEDQQIAILQKVLTLDPLHPYAQERLIQLQSRLPAIVTQSLPVTPAAPEPSPKTGLTDALARVNLEQLILRFGLASSAVLLWDAAIRLWHNGDQVRQSISLGLAIADYLVSFLLIVLAARRSVSFKVVWLVPIALLFVSLTHFQVHVVVQNQFADPLTTDSFMFSDYGATLVRMGQNPYAYDLADAYRVYRASYTYSTPFLNGDFTGRSPYPALSFLLHVPFQLLGIPSSWIYFILAQSVIQGGEGKEVK